MRRARRGSRRASSRSITPSWTMMTGTASTSALSTCGSKRPGYYLSDRQSASRFPATSSVALVPRARRARCEAASRGGVELRRDSPPPWSVEKTNACFIVRDANGQALACTLFRGGARPSLGGAPPHPRRGEAHRLQHRQAAGAAAQAVGHQKLPAAFSGPARGLRRRRAIR